MARYYQASDLIMSESKNKVLQKTSIRMMAAAAGGHRISGLIYEPFIKYFNETMDKIVRAAAINAQKDNRLMIDTNDFKLAIENTIAHEYDVKALNKIYISNLYVLVLSRLSKEMSFTEQGLKYFHQAISNYFIKVLSDANIHAEKHKSKTINIKDLTWSINYNEQESELAQDIYKLSYNNLRNLLNYIKQIS